MKPTSRMVFLAHNDPISIGTAWLEIRTDIFSTSPVSICLALKGQGIGFGLYIKILRVSLYLCGLSWAHDFAVMNLVAKEHQYHTLQFSL